MTNLSGIQRVTVRPRLREKREEFRPGKKAVPQQRRNRLHDRFYLGTRNRNGLVNNEIRLARVDFHSACGSDFLIFRCFHLGMTFYMEYPIPVSNFIPVREAGMKSSGDVLNLSSNHVISNEEKTKNTGINSAWDEKSPINGAVVLIVFIMPLVNLRS